MPRTSTCRAAPTCGAACGAARFTVTCTEANRRTLATLAPAPTCNACTTASTAGCSTPSQRQPRVRRCAAGAGGGPVARQEGPGHADRRLPPAARRGLPFRCEIVGYGEEQERLLAHRSRSRAWATRATAGQARPRAGHRRVCPGRVFVQPSRITADGDRDGIPNVLLEAMAMGLPVVASRVSGIPEVVRHHENGLLVAGGRRRRRWPMPSARSSRTAGARGAAGRARPQRGPTSLRQRPATCARCCSPAARSPPTAPTRHRNPASPPEMDTHDTRVAYVMNGFPRLSETFIAHEIHQLERLGWACACLPSSRSPNRWCTRWWRDPRAADLPAGGELALRLHLARWLRDNLPPVWRAHAALLRAARWRLGRRTLGSALRWPGSHRSRDAPDRCLAAQGVHQGVPAGRLHRRRGARSRRRRGPPARPLLPRRGHHHLAGQPLSGLPFSFTAHAKDIYQAELNPGRPARAQDAVRRASWPPAPAPTPQVLRARHPRPDEVHAIYHGLDTDWFTPRPAPAAEPPLILAVGRLVEKKGFDQLIEACARLRDRACAFAA
jgi:glycosyltransferase involved in cell wall biosynthesis